MHLQESGEMYLETILVLSKKQEKVRSIDISNHMGYSKPSVSRAMKILKENGYVYIDGGGNITLSNSGREEMIAYIREENGIYERHTVLSGILEYIGVSPMTASEDACRIEHVISDESFAAIKKRMPVKEK